MSNAARIRELQQANAKLQADNATLQATVEQQQQTIDEQQSLLEELQRNLNLLKRSLFGHRRERFEDPAQGMLFDFAVLEEETATAASDASAGEPESPDSEQKKKNRRGRVLASPLVQADETPVKLLQPGTGKAKTSYLWAVLDDASAPYTTFYFTEDRSRAGPEQWFAGYRGWLVSDAYIVYELLGEASLGRIPLAGCHVHARRKFESLHVLGPTQATSRALGYFQRLLLIEDELRDLSDDERLGQRDLRSRPLLEEMKAWFDDQLTVLRPRHALRGAIEYMTKRWDCFTRFLESGSIPMHNNDSEQAVKNPVMGKKNWLFFGSVRGGEAGSVLFTLTATCRRLKIDPHAYLTDVCGRLPLLDVTDEASLSSLLPDERLASHPESRLEMRMEESAAKLSRQRDRRRQRRQALGAA